MQFPPLLAGIWRSINGEDADDRVAVVGPQHHVGVPLDVDTYNPKAPTSRFLVPRTEVTSKDIGWMKRDPALQPGPDRSADFQQLYARAVAGEDILPPAAKDYVFLSLPGVLAKHFPNYMEENERWLMQRGYVVCQTRIDSNCRMADNALVVKGAIEQIASTGKKVVLLTHSKGGVDAAAALALYPELKQHVVAFAAMQPPFGGSPIAADIMDTFLLKRSVASFIKKIVGGDDRTTEDLTYRARRAFLRKHPWPSDVPTATMSTRAKRVTNTVFGPLLAYMNFRYGCKNDGVIAEDDCYIPGAARVMLEGVDHLGTVMPAGLGTQSCYEPGAVSAALLALAFRQANV